MSNTKEKYSRGPWETYNLGHVVLIESPEDKMHSIGKVFGGKMEANASLIAAAPDLLEALEFYVTEFEAVKAAFPVLKKAQKVEEFPYIKKAKAAIRRAHGGIDGKIEKVLEEYNDFLKDAITTNEEPEFITKAKQAPNGENLTDAEKETIERAVANMVSNDEIGLKLLAALKGVCERMGWDWINDTDGLDIDFINEAKAAIKLAESELPIQRNGNYTDDEKSCRGCMGPCGQCHESDKRLTVGGLVKFEYPTKDFEGSEILYGRIIEDLGNSTYKVSADERELILNESDLFFEEGSLNIKIITPKEMSRIIEERKPIGLFITKEEIEDAGAKVIKWIACDNSTGHAWTEDFNARAIGMDWLGARTEKYPEDGLLRKLERIETKKNT